MVKMGTITKITKKEFDLIKITQEVKDFVESSGIENGVVYVITAHTTTGILVNESLKCLETDIEATLDRLIPTVAPYAHNHFLPSYGATGNNAPGHLKSMLAGNHTVLPVKDGKVVSGAAQDIYLAEFDGVQERKVFLTVIGE